jgi:hypothetical protein
MTNSLLIFLCGDRMRRYFLVGHTMEILFGVTMTLSILWIYRASVSGAVLRGYPWSVRLHMSLPFNRRWIDEVAPEHVAPIRKFRRAQFSLPLVLLAFGLWIVTYADLLGTRVVFMLAAGQCGP